jgi:hypothetical protein
MNSKIEATLNKIINEESRTTRHLNFFLQKAEAVIVKSNI